MKIILKTNIPKVGQKGDVKEVKDGYGRNFLIARGLAEIATEAGIKHAEETKKTQSEKAEELKKTASEQTKQLDGKILELTFRADEKGTLFRGVGKSALLKEIQKQGFDAVGEDSIIMDKPLKTTGEHDIKIKMGQIEGKLKVIVKQKT